MQKFIPERKLSTIIFILCVGLVGIAVLGVSFMVGYDEGSRTDPEPPGGAWAVVEIREQELISKRLELERERELTNSYLVK